ncbi:hypothetical protein SSBG_00453 [Streptomyces sp. SPB074]|nr:hypothetical protein SSBG_00453 [Streptomyces sp. SPB074]
MAALPRQPRPRGALRHAAGRRQPLRHRPRRLSAPVSYSFTDAEIQAAAVRLGVIKAGEDVPARLRSRVVASLVADRRRPTSPAEVPVAQQVVIEPGGQISVDGRPFP